MLIFNDRPELIASCRPRVWYREHDSLVFLFCRRLVFYVQLQHVIPEARVTQSRRTDEILWRFEATVATAARNDFA